MATRDGVRQYSQRPCARSATKRRSLRPGRRSGIRRRLQTETAHKFFECCAPEAGQFNQAAQPSGIVEFDFCDEMFQLHGFAGCQRAGATLRDSSSNSACTPDGKRQ